MALTPFSDNIETNAPKVLDNKNGRFSGGKWRPYSNVAEYEAAYPILASRAWTQQICVLNPDDATKADIYMLDSNKTPYKVIGGMDVADLENQITEETNRAIGVEGSLQSQISQKANAADVSEVVKVTISNGATTYTNIDYASKNDVFLLDLTSGQWFELDFDASGVAQLGFTVQGSFTGALFGTLGDFERIYPLFVDSVNLLNNKAVILGQYNTNGNYTENENRVTSEKIKIDTTKSYIASGLGVVATNSPRFHFWTEAGAYIGNTVELNGYVLSNGLTSQTITPADYPVGTARVSVQIANVTGIGNAAPILLPPFDNTTMLQEGTVASEWQPFGLLLKVDSISYDVKGKDDALAAKIADVSYDSKNLVDMTSASQVIGRGYNADGSLATINANRLGVAFLPVDPDDWGKEFIISGYGAVPSNYALVVMRDETGTVIFIKTGDPLNAPREYVFTMLSGTKQIGFSVAAETGVGNQSNGKYLNNNFTYTFQFEEGNVATSPTIPNKTYIDAEKIAGLNKNLPPCFVSYDPVGFEGREQLFFYVKRGIENRYVGFSVQHELDNDPLIWKDLYRIVRANDYLYERGGMSLRSTDTIFGGESECVYQDMRGGKLDFTGGVHGDEKYQEFAFFIDGVKQDPAVALTLVACEYAHYIQLSTMYETANTPPPTPVPGHPPNNTHYKKTVFGYGGYETTNVLKWIASFPIFWYHGISCIGKSGASWAYNENFELNHMNSPVETRFFEDVGQHTIEYYNDTNKISAIATSYLESASVPDSYCVVFVDDRLNDSKYYRQTPVYTTVIGQEDKSVMTVKFN